jgi:hypothetical protein
MVYRTSFQFSPNFLPAILEICSDDVAALQYATRPRVTGISIRPSKRAFRVIEVLMEDFSISLDLDAAVPAISDRNAAFFTRANVVIGCCMTLSTSSGAIE